MHGKYMTNWKSLLRLRALELQMESSITARSNQVTPVCNQTYFILLPMSHSNVVQGTKDIVWTLQQGGWIHDEQIVPWARENEIDRMVGGGRKGWARDACRHGYTAEWSMVMKEVA